MKKAIMWLLLCIIFLSGCSVNQKQYEIVDISSYSINGESDMGVPSDHFHFIVFAHAYGDPEGLDSIPAVTLINSLPELESYSPSFMFSLGDMVKRGKKYSFENLKTELLNKINIPVFNAVGNHDVKDRELYTEEFGQTYYAFEYGNAQFIVLDTEIDNCNILDDQKQMLEDQLALALQNDNIDHVFIMMHKVLFLDSDIIESSLTYMMRPNDYEIFKGNNFEEILSDVIMPFAEEKPVYMFAGDVGAFGGNMSPFYNKYESKNVYSYAAGIGDTSEDVVLIIENSGKNVNVIPYQLVDGKELRIDDYSQQYWEEYNNDASDGISQCTEMSKNLVLDVCRFSKDTFNLRCRYFFLITGMIVAGILFGIVFLFVRIFRLKKSE